VRVRVELSPEKREKSYNTGNVLCRWADNPWIADSEPNLAFNSAWMTSSARIGAISPLQTLISPDFNPLGYSTLPLAS
jgi:hypothetical protein